MNRPGELRHGSAFPRPEGVAQTGGSFAAPRDSPAEELLLSPDLDPLPGAGDGGIDQLARQDGGVAVGQKQQDRFEFRSLTFMDRQGIDGFVFGKTDRSETANAAPVDAKKCTQFSAPLRIGQDETDIAVEEPQAIIVFRDHHRAAGVPGAVCADETRLAEDAFAKDD